jgi:hypothetical protein
VPFASIRLENCFPELHGFVLLDPARLEAFYGAPVRGLDLLKRFTRDDDGERVCREGVAIPMTGIDAGDYTILVRDPSSPAIGQQPRLRSSGWILGTERGSLLLCGLGYLTHWDPQHPRHVRLEVPPGWYQVEIAGHVLHEGTPSEEWIYELTMSHAHEKPVFEADLSTNFGLFP